jgi:two-component sensor histidine kinase
MGSGAPLLPLSTGLGPMPTEPSLLPLPESAPDGTPAAEPCRRRHDALCAFSRVAGENADLDHLLQMAAAQAVRGTGGDAGAALRHRAEQGDLLVAAGVGWKPGVVGTSHLLADTTTPCGRAWQTRQPVIVADLPNDAEFRDVRFLRDHGVVALLSTPILVDNEAWGVLEVDTTRPHPFGQDDMAFLGGMAAVLGLALQQRQAGQRAKDAGARVGLAVAEQQTLLQEMRHRHKNDLQIIMTMMMLQMRQQQDPAAREAIQHVMERVRAVSMLQEQLTAREGATTDLAAYLQALCRAMGQRRDSVRIVAELTPAVVAHEQAVSVGLIVNELVTNALKHAFPEDGPGSIRVLFRADPDRGEGHVEVADDGCGMGPPRAGGSGLGLIQALVQRLGGRLTSSSTSRGTSVRLDFLLVR